MTHTFIITLSYVFSLLILGILLGLSIIKYYKTKNALKQVQKKHAT